MTTSAASNGCSLGAQTAEELAALAAHRQQCLVRYQAQQFAREIYSTKGMQGWREKAERSLRASPELEQEARRALNRMMGAKK